MNATCTQAAILFLRAKHGSTYTPPDATGKVFSDVAADSFAAAWIEQLYAEDITSGCGPSLYCPEAPVSRAQAAIFLLRGEHRSTYNPPDVGTSTGFNGIASTNFAAAWLKQLAAENITSGCGSSLYCPAGSITRAGMAVFW